MAGVLVVVAGDGGDTASGATGTSWPLRALDGEDLAWEIACIDYSVADIAEQQEAAAGDNRLPAAVPVRAWGILGWLQEPSIVHVCGPYTRAGEAAVLAAKLLGRRVVLSDFARRSSSIGESLGLIELADAVVCRSDEEAASLPRHGRLEVLDLSAPSAWPDLSALYGQLLAEGNRPS